ncbi:MAG: hypothetical protein WBD03_00260 [Thermoplasmata archaeon]
MARCEERRPGSDEGASVAASVSGNAVMVDTACVPRIAHTRKTFVGQ